VPKNPTLTRLSTVLGTTAVIFLLDWFYLAYIASKGFELKIHEFMLGTVKLSIPLQWLPVVGVVLVSFVAWFEVSFTLFPRRAAPEQDTLSILRLMRVILVSLAAFVCVLYIPYIIGSDWFWTRMSSASNISQLHDFAQSFLNAEKSVMGLDQIWQYSISQFASLLVMVSSAWIFGRGPRRIRK
jgi:hypothetical protein